MLTLLVFVYGSGVIGTAVIVYSMVSQNHDNAVAAMVLGVLWPISVPGLFIVWLFFFLTGIDLPVNKDDSHA